MKGARFQKFNLMKKKKHSQLEPYFFILFFVCVCFCLIEFAEKKPHYTLGGKKKNGTAPPVTATEVADVVGTEVQADPSLKAPKAPPGFKI